MESTVQVISSENVIDLLLHIRNQGDEKATNVVIEIFIDNSLVKKQYIGDIATKQSQSYFISLPNGIGSSILYSVLRYTVPNGIEYSYPLNVYAFPFKSDPCLDFISFPVNLIDVSELKLVLSNNSRFKKELKITPILPYEIKCEPSFKNVTLFPHQQKIISFCLLNRWAPVNSQYPGFFIVQGPTGEAIGSASFTIYTRPHKEKRLGVLGLLISILIILALLEISKVLDCGRCRKEECL